MPTTVPSLEDLQAVADRVTALGAAVGGVNDTLDRLNTFAADTAAYLASLEDRIRRLEKARVVTTYGSSAGKDLAATWELLAPATIRTYVAAQRGTAISTHPTVPLWHSYKPDMVKLAAGDPVMVAATVAAFAPLMDEPGQYATCYHEYDNNIGADPAVWSAAWDVFLAVVMPQVNTGRKFPLRTAAVVTGLADLEKWHIPGADVVGCDSYSTRSVATVQAFAKAKGKPWALGEYGYSTSLRGSDADMLARLETDYAIWSGNGWPAETVCWYNNGNTLLNSTTPLTAGAWRRLCTTGVL